MKRNNRGFTLIEVIVTLAILSVVSGSIVGFMVMASNQYRSSNTEVNLQFESQVVMNQIKDLIIDANKGVAYAAPDADGAEHTGMYDAELPQQESGSTVKRLYIYKNLPVDIVTWKEEERELYYSTASLGADKTLQGETDQVLMSKYVSEFSVDLRDLESKRIVKITLTLASGSRHYTSNHTIYLRNKVTANAPLDEVYEGVEESMTTKVSSINITPSTAIVLPGNTQTFAARVEPFGFISQDVIWSVEGNASASTNIDQSGVLYLAADETADTLKVKAVSAVDDKSSATANVTVKKVTGISVTRADGKAIDSPVYQGEDIQLKAVVIFNPSETGDETSAELQQVNWSIESGPASISQYGVLQISDTAEVGSVIKVKAASSHDANRYVIKEFKVDNYSIKISGGPDLINRNAYDFFNADVSGIAGFNEDNITWDIALSVVTSKGSVKTVMNVNNYVKWTGTGSSTRVSLLAEEVQNMLDFGEEFRMTVTVKYNDATYSKVTTIKKVAVKFGDSYTAAADLTGSTTTESINYSIEGISNPTITWITSPANKRVLTSDGSSAVTMTLNPDPWNGNEITVTPKIGLEASNGEEIRDSKIIVQVPVVSPSTTK